MRDKRDLICQDYGTLLEVCNEVKVVKRQSGELFGTMGKTGAGAGEEQGVQDKIDLYFSTFAKSMASIGAFVSGDRDILDNLRYKLRSQIFAKSLPMPIVIGNLKRLELIKNSPKFKDKLWEIVNTIQDSFKFNGFNIL